MVGYPAQGESNAEPEEAIRGFYQNAPERKAIAAESIAGMQCKGTGPGISRIHDGFFHPVVEGSVRIGKKHRL